MFEIDCMKSEFASGYGIPAIFYDSYACSLSQEVLIALPFMIGMYLWSVSFHHEFFKYIKN